MKNLFIHSINLISHNLPEKESWTWDLHNHLASVHRDSEELKGNSLLFVTFSSRPLQLHPRCLQLPLWARLRASGSLPQTKIFNKRDELSFNEINFGEMILPERARSCYFKNNLWNFGELILEIEGTCMRKSKSALCFWVERLWWKLWRAFSIWRSCCGGWGVGSNSQTCLPRWLLRVRSHGLSPSATFSFHIFPQKEKGTTSSVLCHLQMKWWIKWNDHSAINTSFSCYYKLIYK